MERRAATRIDTFISQDYITPQETLQALIGLGFWPILPVFFRVQGHGDDRGQIRTFGPPRTRATVVLDAGNGWGYIASNSTKYRFQTGPTPWGPWAMVGNRTVESRTPMVGWEHGGRHWIRVYWVTPDRLRVRFQLTAAGVPASAPGVTSIQHQHVYRAVSEDKVWHGNQFPSRSVYRYRGCSYIGFGNRFNATDFSQLGNVPTFPHDGPVYGVLPTS